ncbi:hypothetical protein BBOU_3001 [Bifidobacterium boum]|uniref:Uncharacterized protein n=1 Tax=Bifidobacterium boum TaxID=78343 RepID=A0A086ZPP9_9BIFI|nr:hypothetical protein BBOU_3001 [Bifidobacterium boum]
MFLTGASVLHADSIIDCCDTPSAACHGAIPWPAMKTGAARPPDGRPHGQQDRKRHGCLTTPTPPTPTPPTPTPSTPIPRSRRSRRRRVRCNGKRSCLLMLGAARRPGTGHDDRLEGQARKWEKLAKANHEKAEQADHLRRGENH